MIGFALSPPSCNSLPGIRCPAARRRRTAQPPRPEDPRALACDWHRAVPAAWPVHSQHGAGGVAAARRRTPTSCHSPWVRMHTVSPWPAASWGGGAGPRRAALLGTAGYPPLAAGQAPASAPASPCMRKGTMLGWACCTSSLAVCWRPTGQPAAPAQRGSPAAHQQRRQRLGHRGTAAAAEQCERAPSTELQGRVHMHPPAMQFSGDERCRCCGLANLSTGRVT